MSQTEEKPEKPKTYEDGVNDERIRLITLFLKERASMAGDYRQLIKHTGGLLSQSMTYAYSRGLDDAFKLINKRTEDEKTVK